MQIVLVYTMKKFIPVVAFSVLVFACNGNKSANKQSEDVKNAKQGKHSSVQQKTSSSVQSLSSKNFVPDRIFYKFGDASVQENHKADLKTQAKYIKEKLAENTNLEVIVEGNCDERGGVEYNMVLGQKRADSVKAFLISEGISADKIKTISFGKERVLVQGTTAVAYLQNRVAITKVEAK
jgi:peptidoglycan-associated lipoprotein